MPEIAGGSVSSPTIGVATPLAGAPAHARVIIFRLFGLVGWQNYQFGGPVCTFGSPQKAKTTFRALKMGRRMRRALGFRADEAQKRVHAKRCDSSNAAKTSGVPAHRLKIPDSRPPNRDLAARSELGSCPDYRNRPPSQQIRGYFTSVTSEIVGVRLSCVRLSMQILSVVCLCVCWAAKSRWWL